ncbi:MAG: hypothetical protein ACRCT8_05740 [Lacipirellulaceae bacterium]
MNPMPQRRTRAVAALALAVVVGCGDRRSFEERIRDYGALPGATATTDPELRSLLGAVAAQGGLPESLRRRDPSDSSNAAEALAQLFDDKLRWVLATPVEKHVADELGGRLARDAQGAHSENVTALLARHAELRDALRVAADLPRCSFPLDPTLGHFAKQRHLDDAAIAARIALLEATDAARREKPHEAYDPVARALRWAHWLSREPQVEARVLAVKLRDEAFRAAGLLFASGTFGRPEAEALYAVLRDQLANWPSDRRMLLVDRAVTLHAYEAVRDGQANRVLTIGERARLDRAGKLEPLVSAGGADFDRDAANYLRGMNRLLDAADGGPFFERLAELDKARGEASRPPDLLAARIFLADVPDALRLLARDRARCEAWSIALASAGDFTMPPFRINPTNGRAYDVDRDAEWVRVKLGDPLVADPACPVLQRPAKTPTLGDDPTS